MSFTTELGFGAPRGRPIGSSKFVFFVRQTGEGVKMRYSIICIVAVAIVLSGCATVQLPKNASLVESGGGTYLSKIDFSYIASANRDFSKAKLCVAEHVSNPDVALRDAAGSFVGPFSRTYYQANNTQTVSGKGLFKYLDDANSVLIANGTISAKSGFAVVDIIKFEMKVSISGSKVGLLLSNITRAQQNTGNMANDGFNPIGVWPMSRSEEAYSELEKMANNVKSCIGG